MCTKQHAMPEKGLPTSKNLIALISMKPAEVSRGTHVESLKQKLKEIKNKYISLKLIKTESRQLRAFSFK